MGACKRGPPIGATLATTPPAHQVDLNSDLGEGFGAYRMGADADLLTFVTSANVACGFHGGDPEIMAATFAQARDLGVSVGAHPGFADLWGFGRRNIPHSPGEIERLVAYQIGAAQALSAYAGHPITYVKAHGALGNLAQTDPIVATAVTRAMLAVDRRLVCLAIALGQQERIAAELGLDVRSEIFADRAYADDGMLMSRQRTGSVIHDPATAAARVVRMVKSGTIETESGAALSTPIHSICLHSDTPNAVSIATAVRAALEGAGIAVRAFSTPR